MSREKVIEVVCPYCGEKIIINLTVARWMTVLDEEQRELVCKQLTFECPNCGRPVSIAIPPITNLDFLKEA
jgi:predicted RNA-binding Zn-ribbon protein involved in translation (DUF1610 family)